MWAFIFLCGRHLREVLVLQRWCYVACYKHARDSTLSKSHKHTKNILKETEKTNSPMNISVTLDLSSFQNFSSRIRNV